MKENVEKNIRKEGLPWKNAAKVDTYKKAEQKRQALLREWKENKVTHMQVKVKKLSTGFVIKVRADPNVSKSPVVKKNKRKSRKPAKKV